MLEAKDALFAYTERRVAAALAALPKGIVRGRGLARRRRLRRRADPDRRQDHHRRRRRRCSTCRAATSSARARSTRPMAMTFSACAYALRVQFDPDIPVNDGFYRWSRDRTPRRDSSATRSRPAAIGAGSEMGMRVCEVVAPRAGAGKLPDAAVGDSKGTILNISLGGIDPRTGQYFVFYETRRRGRRRRGASRTASTASSRISRTPRTRRSRRPSAAYPFRIDSLRADHDSGGAGRRRGGLGLRRDYVAESDVVFYGDGRAVDLAPRGMFGGGERPGGRLHAQPRTPASST